MSRVTAVRFTRGEETHIWLSVRFSREEITHTHPHTHGCLSVVSATHSHEDSSSSGSRCMTWLYSQRPSSRLHKTDSKHDWSPNPQRLLTYARHSTVSGVNWSSGTVCGRSACSFILPDASGIVLSNPLSLIPLVRRHNPTTGG